MASSSTSSIPKSFKYDVFLSFRGEDTRKNFVDHLYLALKNKGIDTYKDDKNIKKGERIDDQLIQSIEDSRFYIIVLSKNYASSSWCLDELVKIMECQKKTEHTAYPIFYDVEPTEVRKQKGAVQKAFAENEKKVDAGKWRKALEEAAGLAGWESANEHEANFIQKIVQVISLDLRPFNFNVDKKLIGMETRIEGVVSSLEIGHDDVRMIGIKGMGGGGKTTLARAVFDHISFLFEGKSFVENVREVSKSTSFGLKSLQKQVLSDVLNDPGINVSSVYDGKNMMRKTMSRRKVLVVLDDVDHREQLEALAGEHNWFKPGSRIIITTRDKQVLVAHRVNLIRDVNLLSDKEAICLFSRYAFGREIPIEGYKELSGEVVRYAAGLPLTITVLGSDLCGKDELEWIDAIDRLKKIPLKETLEQLELSYKSLEEDYKEIFLDVACILKGWRKDKAIRVLESCGFHARNGLRVLEQKSLITLSDNNFLGMHDHIEEMGRNIVRRSHPDKPKKHSRLWIKEKIEDILANDWGTKETRCIKLYSGELSAEVIMKGLRKMKKLRFLHISSRKAEDCFHSVHEYLPNDLQYLSWTYYPFRSLPKTFQAKKLAALEICHSNIVQLWEDGERKVLNKLKFLDLSNSKLETLDLGLTSNLESLSLESCYNLVELHMPVGCLNLRSLNIRGTKLRTLDLQGTPNLETLSLENCNDLEDLNITIECLKLVSIYLRSSKLKTLNLGRTPNLKTLRVENCDDLEEFHMPFECPELTSLNLSHSKLRTFDVKKTPNLEALSFEDCNYLVKLHMPVGCLKLESLCIKGSTLSTLDLGGTTNLKKLSLKKCDNLVRLRMPVGCLKLRSLNVSLSKLATLDLEGASNLETLRLSGCYGLEELCMPVGCLELKSLKVKDSKISTLDLRQALNLETLSLERCDELSELLMPDKCEKLTSFHIFRSKYLRSLNLGKTPNLKNPRLEKCDNLEEFRL